MSNQGNRLIVALNRINLDSTEAILRQLQNEVGCFCFGLDTFSCAGCPQAVRVIREYGDVFYDGKFNDLPHIVEEASRVVSSLGVSMFSVHASMGKAGMEAAEKGRTQGHTQSVTPQKNYSVPSKILAITVLTSLSNEDSLRIFGSTCESKVLDFARMALEAGLDGVICSPEELPILSRAHELDGLLKVVAGVRPDWWTESGDRGDQSRVMTPKQAIRLGADYLEIGRPVTEPGNGMTPLDAVRQINYEIAEALVSM